jgi:hypothetical protein
MGAVQAVDGTGVLVRPILFAIRQVSGRRFWRIESFNDDPATTHPLVLQVLHQARENLIDRLADDRRSAWWRKRLERALARRSALR